MVGDGGSVEPASQRGLLGLGVNTTLIFLLHPGQSGSVQQRQSQIRFAFEHGE